MDKANEILESEQALESYLESFKVAICSSYIGCYFLLESYLESFKVATSTEYTLDIYG